MTNEMATRTACVHAGREDFAALRVHAAPLDLSSTYPLGSPEAAEHAFDVFGAGGVDEEEPVYGRLHNPTVARFERAVAGLERCEASVAFASGMAALTACLLALEADAREVVAIRPLYGGCDHLLGSALLGARVRWARPETVAEAITPSTGLVLLETPQNPTLGLVDVEAVVAAARGVPVLVDNTFATPILQNPVDQGAALVVHSASKLLGGHGDVMAGVVATSEERARRLRRIRIATGSLLHPLAAYLLLRSLPTLPLRVREAQAGASALAVRLAAHPLVARVDYPGLPGADPHGLLGRQLRGPGSVLSFEVVGGRAAADAVLAGLRLVTPAVSLGSTDTLVQRPAGLTHRFVDPSALAEGGISPGLLRLSIGLEDPDDLWGDLAQALDAAVPALAVAF
ncbi:MAG TPA: PLP-dependent transferase [Gaiellaceae bacterium]|nr:PLP-dependent transferase [Gaiellaceae bacterium]